MRDLTRQATLRGRECGGAGHWDESDGDQEGDPDSAPSLPSEDNAIAGEGGAEPDSTDEQQREHEHDAETVAGRAARGECDLVVGQSVRPQSPATENGGAGEADPEDESATQPYRREREPQTDACDGGKHRAA